MKKPELRSLVRTVLKEIGNVGVGYKKWGTPGADGYGSNDSKVDDINGDNSGTAATGGILANEEIDPQRQINPELQKINIEKLKQKGYVVDWYRKNGAAVLEKTVNGKVFSMEITADGRVAGKPADNSDDRGMYETQDYPPYTGSSKQDEIIVKLEKTGYVFSNWLENGNAVLIKKDKHGGRFFGRTYKQVDTDGDVNGQPFDEKSLNESEVATIKKDQAKADDYAKRMFGRLQSARELTPENITIAIRVAYEHGLDQGYDQGYDFAEKEFKQGKRITLPNKLEKSDWQKLVDKPKPTK